MSSADKPSELEIGSTITFNGKEQRIVRVVLHSLTLVEFPEGPKVLDESYVQLKDANGVIDFHTFFYEERPYEGQAHAIRGEEPLKLGAH